MKSFALGAVVAVCVADCGGQGSPSEPVAASSIAIQGGTNDTTHSFVVAVVQQRTTSQTALCSGALLAPNLVATARHCVAAAPATIDCSTSVFGSVASPSAMYVTTDPSVTIAGHLYGVSQIIVPSGTNHSQFCGNDIALLILSQTISLPQYVTPVISPPMTDHTTYATSMTAIGYGVNTPADTTGTSAGVRRIRENIPLACIPNDTTFVDCFRTRGASRTISANEFQSGNGPCDGDSGSNAFDQNNFNVGAWFSFGVLSRGSVSSANADAATCVGSIYTRFDAWAQLLIDAANQAAATGGYGAPGWASSSDDAGLDARGDASADAGASASTDTGQSSLPEGGPCLSNGTPCRSNGDCCAANCLSHDNGSTFVCAACDSSAPCDKGYTCEQGACILTPNVDGGGAGSSGGANQGQPGGTSRARGCAISAPHDLGPARWRALTAALGLAGLSFIRRRHLTRADGGGTC